MTLPELSTRRPIFVTCICIVIVVLGIGAFRTIPVDLFPDVNFPIVTVQTVYPGAGPKEIETLVTKPLEDQVAKISGLKRLTSKSIEGVSLVTAEFTSSVKTKEAEQKIRDQVALAKPLFPRETEEPVIRKMDTSDLPIMTLSVTDERSQADLYDWVDLTFKPMLEQVDQVGLVEIVGGRKREIQVLLDRKKLRDRELSAGAVASGISQAGENIPGGTLSKNGRQILFRSVGEFSNLSEIQKTIVSFFGNEVPLRVSDVGEVVDTLEDEKSRVFVSGKPSLFVDVYRQSGANTLSVANGIKKKVAAVNSQDRGGAPKIEIVRDSSTQIQDNVDDVYETILLGILLTILVVYFFLSNMRSTIITGLAIPNSLIGAFILMSLAGFSINIVSLLSLSLAVGLLIDDAIVVRENIFRKMELGEKPMKAAVSGALEVQLAVVATTLVVIAVFAPVAFMQGVVGQFLKQFGLTVCFAMAISLFDALTIAPMLSAYFGGHVDEGKKFALVRWFDRFQTWLERLYRAFLSRTLRRPWLTIAATVVIFAGSCSTLTKIPSTFIPEQDSGDFMVDLDMEPGTSLDAMASVSREVEDTLLRDPEVELTALSVGGRNGEAYQANLYVKLKKVPVRKSKTEQVKARTRDALKPFARANPKVKDYDPFNSGIQPFMLSIQGNDFDELQRYATLLLDEVKNDKRLTDADMSYRTGQPEFQIALAQRQGSLFGLNPGIIGDEIRAQVEGVVPAKYRVEGKEYDVRVRMNEAERDLRTEFDKIWVPNVNRKLVRLASVAKGVENTGPAAIDRQNRNRYIVISAGVAPGAGLSEVMADTEKTIKEKLKFPPTLTTGYMGDSENFQEMMSSIGVAFGLAAMFIFLILASLYESFVTPITIMIALPLAAAGAFVALFATGESINLFSLLGIVMLLGVAGKNSILLVDRARQLQAEGKPIVDALLEAGETRLRPILMTSLALIAGTIPVAIGLNEASKQRTSMGIAIIGGVISSTLLSLVVIPSAHYYIDRIRQKLNFR